MKCSLWKHATATRGHGSIPPSHTPQSMWAQGSSSCWREREGEKERSLNSHTLTLCAGEGGRGGKGKGKEGAREKRREEEIYLGSKSLEGEVGMVVRCSSQLSCLLGGQLVGSLRWVRENIALVTEPHPHSQIPRVQPYICIVSGVRNEEDDEAVLHRQMAIGWRNGHGWLAAARN
jgi:hypothetical protein